MSYFTQIPLTPTEEPVDILKVKSNFLFLLDDNTIKIDLDALETKLNYSLNVRYLELNYRQRIIISEILMIRNQRIMKTKTIANSIIFNFNFFHDYNIDDTAGFLSNRSKFKDYKYYDYFYLTGEIVNLNCYISSELNDDELIICDTEKDLKMIDSYFKFRKQDKMNITVEKYRECIHNIIDKNPLSFQEFSKGEKLLYF